MINLDKISLEYKSAALFGLSAFTLSSVVGFISGIKWDIVILRSFALMTAFAGIGFGVVYIFKKFVPELYNLLLSSLTLHGKGGEIDDADESVVRDASSAEPSKSEEHPKVIDEESIEVPTEGAFKELEKDTLMHYTTTAPIESSINTKSGKLGKHILEKEKLAKYEPKIMAQAVRTMMSKDEE